MSSRLNQKLYYARLLLERAAASPAGAAREALQEAGIWHLATAYRAHLAAIAQGYRHTSAALSAVALGRELAERDVHCPAVGELAQLERRGDWPARLLSALVAVEATTPQKTESAAAPVSVDPLALRMVEVSPEVGDALAWLEALEHVSMAQQAGLQEW